MIQDEQQAEEQNDLAEQQFTQDELQAQQTEQQADPYSCVAALRLGSAKD